MSNNTYSSSSFTTTQRTVSFRGNAIETMVTNEASLVDSWAQGVHVANQGRPIIVSLDCEWKPHHVQGLSNTTPTLQLCAADKCLNVQLFYIDYVPESIKSFLTDDTVTFVGVGVGDDTAKLRNEYGRR